MRKKRRQDSSLSPAVGMPVSLYFGVPYNKWFDGVIVKVEENVLYHIKYGDGDEEIMDQHKCRTAVQNFQQQHKKRQKVPQVVTSFKKNTIQDTVPVPVSNRSSPVLVKSEVIKMLDDSSENEAAAAVAADVDVSSRGSTPVAIKNEDATPDTPVSSDIPSLANVRSEPDIKIVTPPLIRQCCGADLA